MTNTEKILAAHAGRDRVEPGEFIMAKVDIALGNDITAPIAIEEFKKAGVDHVFDSEKIVLLPDHSTPNKDIKSAQLCKAMRDFAREQDLKYYFEVGRMGIEHALLPEMGLIAPGDLVIGADSHTCTYGALGAFATGVGSTDLAAAMITGECWFKVPETMRFVFNGKLPKWVGGKDLILFTIGKIGVDGALYKAMEFAGDAIESLSMDSRLTMCNMAIEAGGKSAIIAPDDVTVEYLEQRGKTNVNLSNWESPSKSETEFQISDLEFRIYDVSDLEPQVAFPHKPENVRPISEAGDCPIDQAFIGSCTNGRMEDLRIAAEVLRGSKVHKHVRLIIIPATQAIYRQAMKEGLFDVFLDAGAAISTPTCGPCLGGHTGVLADGEVCISTTNRNFKGRMGHPDSFVYLSGPAVAAASAILGKIAGPEDVC